MSLLFIFAPLVIKNSTHSKWPVLDAVIFRNIIRVNLIKYQWIHSPISRAVWPFLFFIFESAPFSINIFTTSKRRLAEALIEVFKIFINEYLNKITNPSLKKFLFLIITLNKVYFEMSKNRFFFGGVSVLIFRSFCQIDHIP